jgi:hypothetical protein
VNGKKTKVRLQDMQTSRFKVIFEYQVSVFGTGKGELEPDSG